MIVIVIDTETTTVPAPKHIPLDHESQPWLVELAGVLYDDGVERASFNLIVKLPDDCVVPEFAANIHGITTEIAARSGVPLMVALSTLTHMWLVADLMVAHNLEFDNKIIDIAIARLGREPTNKRPPGKCTMRLATPVLNLPPTPKMVAVGMTKPKRPSLQEAHTALVGVPFEGAHRAIDDARACGRVFFKLQEMGCV